MGAAMSKRLLDKLYRFGVLREGRDGIVSLRMGTGLTRRDVTMGLGASAAAAALLRPNGAQAEASVNFMGWQGYDEGLAAEDFPKKNGIALSTTFMSDNNQVIATARAGGIGNLDIVTPDHGYTRAMSEMGILQELDIARLPNFANLFEFFKTVPGPQIEGRHYSLPYTWGSIPLMYNPVHVKQKPESWRDIMKPEYKGRIALTNDVISVIVPFTMAATGTKTPTRISKEELKATIDLLIDIKKNYARTIASGYGELADLFASGEIVMAQSWEPVAAWAGDKGVKLEWTVPKEGTWGIIDCLALATDAPHKDGAYKLLNHGLSAQAQAKLSNANITGTTVAGAVPLLNDRARAMYPYDDIAGFFKKTGGGPFPIWPLDREGDLATFDDVLAGWERFLKA
jgi:spermidine/putrescine transport system substrate-binding protein